MVYKFNPEIIPKLKLFSSNTQITKNVKSVYLLVFWKINVQFFMRVRSLFRLLNVQLLIYEGGDYINCILWAGSSVGIATELRAGRSGMESRWGRDFSPVETDPGAHPDSCKMGTESFPGVKCGRGVLLTTHPLLVTRSWRSRAIPLPTLWVTPGL